MLGLSLGTLSQCGTHVFKSLCALSAAVWAGVGGLGGWCGLCACVGPCGASAVAGGGVRAVRRGCDSGDTVCVSGLVAVLHAQQQEHANMHMCMCMHMHTWTWTWTWTCTCICNCMAICYVWTVFFGGRGARLIPQTLKAA